MGDPPSAFSEVIARLHEVLKQKLGFDSQNPSAGTR